MKKQDEQILVVKREKVLPEKDVFQGLECRVEKVAQLTEMIANNWEVKRRGDASEPKSEISMESNPSYKQIIPYIVVKQGEKIFCYRRLGKSGEERLHNQISIGVGGHMNDLTSEGWVEQVRLNAERELNEELKFTLPGIGEVEVSIPEDSLTIKGYINDDVNEVGEVHLGLWVELDFSEDFMIEVKETDVLEGFFLTPHVLSIAKLPLEEWTKIVLSGMDV